MEQYLDAKVKRFVQRRLFSRIDKAKTILGLAGIYENLTLSQTSDIS